MTRTLPLITAALCLAVASISATQAGPITIADFSYDYVAGSTDTTGKTRAELSADGWNYLWNSAGAIGTAANYTALVWNPNADAAGAYTVESTVFPIWDDPGDFVYLVKGHGHPGQGTWQEGGGAPDRFTIAAYTIQAGENGRVSISDSSIYVSGNGLTGVELAVYVNNTPITDFYQPNNGAAAQSFNTSLGYLNVGDTVYVTAGPSFHNAADGFDLSYKLVVPEPGTIALLAAALAGLLPYAWRKRRN